MVWQVAAANFAAGLGKGVGDAIAGDSGPNLSGSSADARSFFDGSGWTVSTGSARATGATLTRSSDPFGPSTLQTAGVSGPWAQLAMLGVVAVIALRLLRKSSS